MLPPTLAYALLTLTMAIWGGALVTARGIHELAPPVGLTFWRWLLALCLLLPFVWRKLPALRECYDGDLGRRTCDRARHPRACAPSRLDVLALAARAVPVAAVCLEKATGAA